MVVRVLARVCNLELIILIPISSARRRSATSTSLGSCCLETPIKSTLLNSFSQCFVNGPSTAFCGTGSPFPTTAQELDSFVGALTFSERATGRNSDRYGDRKSFHSHFSRSTWFPVISERASSRCKTLQNSGRAPPVARCAAFQGVFQPIHPNAFQN